MRIVWCTRQKLYHTKNTSTIAFRLSSFLLKPLVRRVNRRSCIRTVKLARSMWLVEMRESVGLPLMSLRVACARTPAQALDGLLAVPATPWSLCPKRRGAFSPADADFTLSQYHATGGLRRRHQDAWGNRYAR